MRDWKSLSVSSFNIIQNSWVTAHDMQFLLGYSCLCLFSPAPHVHSWKFLPIHGLPNNYFLWHCIHKLRTWAWFRCLHKWPDHRDHIRVEQIISIWGGVTGPCAAQCISKVCGMPIFIILIGHWVLLHLSQISKSK